MDKKILLFLLLFCPVLASASNLTSFNDSTSSGTLSFDRFYAWCDQGLANISTSCGGINTGNYSVGGFNLTNVTDNDWNTYSNGDTTNFYVNYSKPPYSSNNSLWEIKDNWNRTNLTIDQDCWVQNPLQFRIETVSLGAGPYSIEFTCYNGSSWNRLRYKLGVGGDKLYDEMMHWWLPGNQTTNETKYLKIIRAAIINDALIKYSGTVNDLLYDKYVITDNSITAGFDLANNGTHIFVVDQTGNIQVYWPNGSFVEYAGGSHYPSGATICDGYLWVNDNDDDVIIKEQMDGTQVSNFSIAPNLYSGSLTSNDTHIFSSSKYAGQRNIIFMYNLSGNYTSNVSLSEMVYIDAIEYDNATQIFYVEGRDAGYDDILFFYNNNFEYLNTSYNLSKIDNLAPKYLLGMTVLNTLLYTIEFSLNNYFHIFYLPTSTMPVSANIGGYDYNWTNNQTTNFTKYLNNSLKGFQCSCVGCVQNGQYCSIPFHYVSALNGTLDYSDLYIDYDFNPELTSCSDGNISLNMVFYDENTPSNYLDSDVEIEIIYWAIEGDVYNYTYNMTGTYNYSVCSDWPGLYSNVYIRYSTTNGFTHRYYLYNRSLDYSNSTNLSLYNYNYTTGVSDLKITTRNISNYNFYPNVVVSLLRKYTSEGVWRTVQMDKSGDFGSIFFNILENDQDYKLVFKDTDNKVLKTTNSMKFVCDSGVCDLTVLLDSYTVTSSDLGLVWDIDVNNDTKIINFTWSDPEGLNTVVRIEATIDSGPNTVIISNTTQSGSAGYIEVNGSNYEGDILINIYNNNVKVVSNWEVLQKLRIGHYLSNLERSWWSIAILVTMIMLGLISPVVTIIMMVVGILVVFFFGLMPAISIPMIIIISTLSIYIGLRLKS